MIKRHILCFVLFYFSIFSGFSNLLHTEEEPKKELGLQIGIDAVAGLFLLSNLISDDNIDDINSNYFLFVKYKFLRLQFGTDINGFFPEDQNFSLEQLQYSYRVRLGAVYTKALNPKFNFFVGGGFIYKTSYSEQKRKFNLQYGGDIINNTNIVHQFGPDIYCGVEWFVAKNLSLSTEANFNFLFSRDIRKEFSEIFPDDLGTEITNKSYETQYEIPFLNLLLRFKI